MTELKQSYTSPVRNGRSSSVLSFASPLTNAALSAAVSASERISNHSKSFNGKQKTTPVASDNHYLNAPCPIFRVKYEDENIGERVALSKKRITWSFVFTNSQTVHTIILEHSRITAKKLVRLDGSRLHHADTYHAGQWQHEFYVDGHENVKFIVAIKDIKATAWDSMNVGNRDGLYELYVNGYPWLELPERVIEHATRHSFTLRSPSEKIGIQSNSRRSSSVWSSSMYARRVDFTEIRIVGNSTGKDSVTKKEWPQTVGVGEDMSHIENLDNQDGKVLLWTFCFGIGATAMIHRLELRDLDIGRFDVYLDAKHLTSVDYEEIESDRWEFSSIMTNSEHELSVIVTLEDEDKTYEFFIDQTPWEGFTETEFILQNDWFPVYSQSQGTTYFCNEKTLATQWDKPTIPRPLSSTKHNSEGKAGNGAIAKTKVPIKNIMKPAQSGNQEEDELLQGFSNVNVKSSDEDMDDDPFNPKVQAKVKQSTKSQQPIDLLS